MKGVLQGNVAIDMLCQLKSSKDFEYELTLEQGTYLFQRACIEAFTDSCDPKKSKKALGPLAESLVCFFTDPDRFPNFEEGFELIQSLPLLNVYGRIEEMYLKLSREAFEIDAFRGGDWPLLLRAMTIPVSDEIFSVRNFDVLPMASANLSKRIFDKMEEFRQIKKLYPNL
jgi:hypothetical protein